MKRIGLFFGSFNPLTNAHVALAKGVVERGCVDETWFVLSPANPAKFKKNILADEEHRRQMMRSYIEWAQDATMKLCDVEYELPRPSYTHRTLSVLKERDPDVEFFIVCGTDTLAKILSWKTGGTILSENRFICSNRGTEEHKWSDEVREKAVFLDIEVPDVSSTQVRGNISMGIAYNDLVPSSIFSYIEAHGLYR